MPRPEILATLDALAACFGEGVFTATQARDAGVAQHRLETAHRYGGLLRLQRGRYQVSASITGLRDNARRVPGLSEEATARVRARIDALDVGGIPARLGTASATGAWELPTYGVPAPTLPILVVPRGSTVRPGSSAGIRIVHRDVAPGGIVTGPGGVPMTDALVAAVHVAARPGLSLAAQLVVLNGAMRRYWEWLQGESGRLSDRDLAGAMSDPSTRQALREELLTVARHADLRDRGSRLGTSPSARSAWRRLVHALDIVDPRIETALESLSWAAFHDFGFEIPQPQARVRGASGTLWRVDFLFRGLVIGECDGAVKYHGGYTPWQEKQRQSDLEARGHPVVRWTWEEIDRRPQDVMDRISLAINRHS